MWNFSRGHFNASIFWVFFIIIGNDTVRDAYRRMRWRVRWLVRSELVFFSPFGYINNNYNIFFLYSFAICVYSCSHTLNSRFIVISWFVRFQSLLWNTYPLAIWLLPLSFFLVFWLILIVFFFSFFFFSFS